MTLKFKNSYIKNSFSVIGRNEHEITIKGDLSINDYYLGEKCVELGEAKYQTLSINGLLRKCNLNLDNIDLMISGDLQSQLLASSFASRNLEIPLIGIYSACATFTEGLLLASNFLNSSEVNNVIVNTSSHNLASEKQFRFPIEYGAIRKKVNTFTATGSVSTLITREKTNIKIETATIGKVVDLGYKDSNNFGACMAPSAAKTIYDHLSVTKRNIDYYDLILTGDLGVYGVNILNKLLEKEYNIRSSNIVDAGTLLFEDSGKTIAGGSGPTCLPLVLFNKDILKRYKKILLVGTGSLHSKSSCNIGESIPSISHAVSLEVINE